MRLRPCASPQSPDIAAVRLLHEYTGSLPIGGGRLHGHLHGHRVYRHAAGKPTHRAGIVPLCVYRSDEYPSSISTNCDILQTATVATGLGLSTGLYTWRWEPHWLEVVERSLPVAHLPERLRGARLVQLSDIHIGPLVDDSYLIDTFQRVRELAPEFVVYTGDFISNDGDDFTHIGRMFRHLPLGTRATVGVLGNHD